MVSLLELPVSLRLYWEVGNIELANEYAKKAEYYKRYLDPETKMMRPVMGDGSFRTPFNPRYSSHMKSDYTEGNAFQWSFFAPHDMDNFIAAIGGGKRCQRETDSGRNESHSVKGPLRNDRVRFTEKFFVQRHQAIINFIESLTILKDASETAQYGSRGASG